MDGRQSTFLSAVGGSRHGSQNMKPVFNDGSKCLASLLKTRLRDGDFSRIDLILTQIGPPIPRSPSRLGGKSKRPQTPVNHAFVPLRRPLFPFPTPQTLFH